MHVSRTRNGARQWARIVMKMGLLLTDPGVWADVNQRLRARVEDATDVLNDKYDDALGRLKDARDALQGENRWVAPATGFLGGVALGAAIGILLAPASGEETRSALRNVAVDVGNMVSNVAEAPFRSSPAS